MYMCIYIYIYTYVRCLGPKVPIYISPVRAIVYPYMSACTSKVPKSMDLIPKHAFNMYGPCHECLCRYLYPIFYLHLCLDQQFYINIHTYTHTYIHTYIHTYVRNYVHHMGSLGLGSSTSWSHLSSPSSRAGLSFSPGRGLGPCQSLPQPQAIMILGMLSQSVYVFVYIYVYGYGYRHRL